MLYEAGGKLASTRLMNLTEFGRAVHAEMEALLSAARNRFSPRGCILYTTTFPCHNCAKHIVAAGISRVVYIEPYPKSLADRLHGDAIAFPEDKEKNGKVTFEPYRGIAPRMYSTLFSSITPEGKRLPRKTSDGLVNTKSVGLRTKASPLNHINREAIVALTIKNLVPSVQIEDSHENYP